MQTELHVAGVGLGGIHFTSAGVTVPQAEGNALDADRVALAKPLLKALRVVGTNGEVELSAPVLVGS